MENLSIEGIGAALGGVVAIGFFVSKFTKTEKDDAIFKRAGDALKAFMPGSKKSD
jgi:hypothetical protein